MPYHHKLILYFDGVARKNPGAAGCGWLLYEMDQSGANDHELLESGSEYLGNNLSKNEAKYEGLQAGLHYINVNYLSCYRLYIRGDSSLILNQLKGNWKVRKTSNLKQHYDGVVTQLECLAKRAKNVIHFRHIPKSQNLEADSLAKEAIDERYWDEEDRENDSSYSSISGSYSNTFSGSERGNYQFGDTFSSTDSQSRYSSEFSSASW